MKAISRFPVLKEEKLPIYRTLCEVGQGVKTITECLDDLNDPVFSKKMLRLFRAQAESLGAGVAYLFTWAMLHREKLDWHRLAKRVDGLEGRQGQDTKTERGRGTKSARLRKRRRDLGDT